MGYIDKNKEKTFISLDDIMNNSCKDFISRIYYIRKMVNDHLVFKLEKQRNQKNEIKEDEIKENEIKEDEIKEDEINENIYVNSSLDISDARYN